MEANWRKRMEQGRELPREAQQTADKWHFLMETPDGEVMSVRQEDMSEYLKRYGTPVEQKKTESSPSSGERR